VLKDKRGRTHRILDMYIEYDQRGNNGMMHAVKELLDRGPTGPEPNARQRNVRLALQETQARALIEKALVEHPTKLGAELTARCKKLLDHRRHVVLTARRNESYLVQCDWDAQAGRLYQLAAEVVARTNKAGR
jgi:hypothetical protein